MRFARLLVLVAFFGISWSVARADSATDPVFKIGTGSTSVVLTSDSFSFSLAAGTTGAVTFDFINFTGAVIGELDLQGPSTGFTFSCDNTGDPYFNSCSPTTPMNAPVKFFGLDATHLGIPTATSVTGDCDNDSEDQQPGDLESCTPNVPLSDFTVTVNVGTAPLVHSLDIVGTLVPAPEPSTLILVFAAGLGFLAAKRFGFAS